MRAATRGACANCYYNGKGRGCELHDLMKDAQQERAEVRKELSMPNPHEALHNLALGLDGLQKWFEWFDDVVAPHLSEVGDARVSP